MSSNDRAELHNIPAAKPPPGITPNHAHPASDGPVAIGIGSLMLALMLIFASVRIYTKARIVKKFGADDYACVVGALGAICYFVVMIAGEDADNGLVIEQTLMADPAIQFANYGVHEWELTLADVSSNTFLILGFFTNWPTAVIWPCIKLSFFFMYIQIFRPMKWLRYGSYVGAVITILFYVCILIVTLAYTVPARGETWQETVESKRGGHSVAMSPYVASGNLILDVYILVLPIAGVSKLKLTQKRKIGVIAIFFTGSIACIASSISIYYRWSLVHSPADLTYTIMAVVLLCFVEMCVGIVASCMPSMSKLVHSLPSWNLGSRFSSYFSSSFISSKHETSHDSALPHPKTKRAQYEGLDFSSSSVGNEKHEMAPIRTVDTYIHTGGHTQVEEDGIRLHYNVEQAEHRYC